MKKKRAKNRPDPAVMGFDIMQRLVAATGDTPDEPARPQDQGKDPAAVELGRKGGLKGGPARATNAREEEATRGGGEGTLGAKGRFTEGIETTRFGNKLVEIGIAKAAGCKGA
jgi:hypothetical protein